MKKMLPLVCLGLIALGGGFYLITRGAEAQPGMMGGEMPPPAVAVTTIAEQTITHFEELPGRTSAYKVAEIRPQVNGIITQRLFEEGSLVEAGQQLYQIDPAPYEAAYARALADLQKARAAAKSIEARAARYEELVKIDAVSRQEYDDIQASVATAKADIAVANAALATAKINVDYTKVYAPIAGRIGKSMVTEGALVTAGQPQALATITQLDPIYVDMSQSSTDLMRLRGKLDGTGVRKVTLILPETSQTYEETGTLQFSDVSVDETTGSVQLRALFLNSQEKLLPGLFVRARIHMDSYQGLLVPQRAAMRGPDGGLTVWVVDGNNTANPRPIETDGAYDDQWIVTSGLNVGEKVITEGYQKIGPGMVVTPEETPQTAVSAENNMPPPPAASEAMSADALLGTVPTEDAAPAPDITQQAPVMPEQE